MLLNALKLWVNSFSFHLLTPPFPQPLIHLSLSLSLTILYLLSFFTHLVFREATKGQGFQGRHWSNKYNGLVSKIARDFFIVCLCNWKKIKLDKGQLTQLLIYIHMHAHKRIRTIDRNQPIDWFSWAKIPCQAEKLSSAFTFSTNFLVPFNHFAY